MRHDFLVSRLESIETLVKLLGSLVGEALNDVRRQTGDDVRGQSGNRSKSLFPDTSLVTVRDWLELNGYMHVSYGDVRKISAMALRICNSNGVTPGGSPGTSREYPPGFIEEAVKAFWS